MQESTRLEQERGRTKMRQIETQDGKSKTRHKAYNTKDNQIHQGTSANIETFQENLIAGKHKFP